MKVVQRSLKIGIETDAEPIASMSRQKELFPSRKRKLGGALVLKRREAYPVHV